MLARESRVSEQSAVSPRACPSLALTKVRAWISRACGALHQNAPRNRPPRSFERPRGFLDLGADEAGCFNFSRNQGASKYYIVCTISCRSCADLGSTLLDLRRQLVWENAPIGEYFHASEDKQVVRDRVFKALQKHDFSIQATIMEKSKALPRIRPTHHRFYQYGWFYHFKHAAPKIIRGVTELHITTASVGTHKGQARFSEAVNDVVQQVLGGGRAHRTNFCLS